MAASAARQTPSTSFPSARIPSISRRDRLPGDGLRVALVFEPRGDGVLVVLADEHRPGVVDAGEVERLVDVALAGRAVAEVGDPGVRPALQRLPPADAGGVQRLRPDGNRRREGVFALGDRGTLLHFKRIQEDLVGRRRPAQQRRLLAERRDDPVVVGHGERAADLSGLPTDGGHVRPDLAASLQRDSPLVEAARALHLLV